MKKIFFYFQLLSLFLCFACTNGAKDNKNEMKAYPNTDTTDKMENLNRPDHDTSSTQR